MWTTKRAAESEEYTSVNRGAFCFRCVCSYFAPNMLPRSLTTQEISDALGVTSSRLAKRRMMQVSA